MTLAVIDGYETVAELGRGEAGLVVRARSATGTDVAIRHLARSLRRSPSFMDRYRREVDALAAVDHPNLAAVRGLTERRDAAFVVTEFVDGCRCASCCGAPARSSRPPPCT